MAGIMIAAPMDYKGRFPLDLRNSFTDISEMLAYPEASLDDGHLSFVRETGKTYQYDSTNEIDSTLGKWRIFNSGGGSTQMEISKQPGNSIKGLADGIYSPNLDGLVSEKEQVDDLQDLPVGTIVQMDWHEAPPHWLEITEDRSIYNIADYPQLAEVIKNTYGKVNHYGGDGITTFSIPDSNDVPAAGTGGGGDFIGELATEEDIDNLFI